MRAGSVTRWPSKGFKDQLDAAKSRFEAAFQAEPESRKAMREQEKKRIPEIFARSEVR